MMVPLPSLWYFMQNKPCNAEILPWRLSGIFGALMNNGRWIRRYGFVRSVPIRLRSQSAHASGCTASIRQYPRSYN